jgi:hypothetical protein
MQRMSFKGDEIKEQSHNIIPNFTLEEISYHIGDFPVMTGSSNSLENL